MFRAPSRGAVGDALARIESPWRLGGTADQLVSEALYCRDSEGNGVEIYRGRDADKWELTADRVAVTDPDGIRILLRS